MEEKLLITEEIANHELNVDLGLEIGKYLRVDKGCKCPDSTPEGFYQCVGSNCVFVPY